MIKKSCKNSSKKIFVGFYFGTINKEHHALYFENVKDCMSCALFLKDFTWCYIFK